MAEHGFSSDFLYNSWDELLNVGLMLFKLALVRLLSCLPCRVASRYFGSVGRKAGVYITYEVLAGAPMVLLPMGVVLGPSGQMGSLNLQSKLNLALFVTYSFALFAAPFLLFYFEMESERQSPSKAKKKRQRTGHEKEEKASTNKDRRSSIESNSLSRSKEAGN